MNEQLSMFPEIIESFKIKEEILVEVPVEIKTNIAESLMDSAISEKVITKPTQENLNTRTQSFLLGLSLNRMDTIRKLLGRVETVEEVMVDPERIKELHPEYLVKIYDVLTRNLDSQIKNLTQVKDTIAQSISIFNTQINQGSVDATDFSPGKVLDQESREKIMNVMKGLVNLQDFIKSSDDIKNV